MSDVNVMFVTIPFKILQYSRNKKLQAVLYLPCGAGSVVPREGLNSSVIMPFSWCVVAVTLPI